MNIKPPSATEPAMAREDCDFFEWNPEKKLIKTIRLYQRIINLNKYILPLAYLAKVLAIIRHRFWSIVCGAEIPLNTSLGGGLILKHGQGVVIHPQSSLGPNCLIMSGVVIGTRGGTGVPRLGGNVNIGSGAKLLGDIVIGDNVVIGANAVVIHDVPSDSTVVGIPARVLGKDRLVK